MRKGIGSVLPAPADDGAGILDTWCEGRPWRAFRTARAALAAWLKLKGIRRVWLPAYICGAVAEGIQASDAEIAWYGVDDRLRASCADLAAAGEGEAVLCVSYFGHGIDDGLRCLAAQRPDLLWIEDRAQALATGGAAFGDVLLYSPRKLFGVGDGGIIASHGALPETILPAEADDWQTNDARAGDLNGLTPETWFPLFQKRERNMDSSPKAASPRTLAALTRLDWTAEAQARQWNWTRLSQRLSHVALWPEAQAGFIPLAYPIITEDAAGLSAGLVAERIWCARHWATLPSPETFAEAHQLSRTCLSLPLDGRYNEDDMARIADTVESILDRRGRNP